MYTSHSEVRSSWHAAAVQVRPTPQSTHASPPVPHALAVVPGWQPVAEQQPFVHVA